MAETLDQALGALLQARLGHAGPWPQHLRRFVQERSRAAGLSELAWLEQIRARPKDRAALIDAATVNHTSFYRHPEHFTRLSAALPKLLARHAPLRVWSAGCSTGEEVWSLALTLQAQGAPFALLGTDASSRAVAAARRGHYPATLTKGLPGYDGTFTFDAPPALRQAAQFEAATLFDEPSQQGRGPFDVIFCRNVLIYFAPDQLAKAWSRLLALLAPWGVVAVAPVESLHGVPNVASAQRSLGLARARRVLASGASPPAGSCDLPRRKTGAAGRASRGRRLRWRRSSAAWRPRARGGGACPARALGAQR